MKNEEASPNGYSAEEESLMIEAGREHLVDFSILTGNDYKANWHHDKIADELELIEKHGDKFFKILLIFMPPRHGKSQETTIDFPAFYLGKHPEREIITSSYSGELAQHFGGKTRDKIESLEYRRLFGDILRNDNRSRNDWLTKAGGGYLSVGVGGAMTGRGADVFIIDDPVKNREEAESRVYQDKLWDWFTSTAWTRLAPGGVMVVILTRWSLRDLAGMILANEGFSKMCRVVKFPAIATHNEEFRHTGEALWPGRYSLEDLTETKRGIGMYDFSALYQQEPITSEHQEFKPAYFQYRTREQLGRTRNFLTIDTAMSKRETADFCGFCDNSVDNDNFWNLMAWRMRLDAKGLVDFIFTKHAARSYEKIGIEKTAYLWGLKPFLDEEQRRRGVFLPIVELDHKQTAKEIRIRGLLPRYESRSIFHIKDECNDLEEELLTFPFAVHDDVMDAAAYQSQIVEASFAPRFKQPEHQIDSSYYANR